LGQEQGQGQIARGQMGYCHNDVVVGEAEGRTVLLIVVVEAVDYAGLENLEKKKKDKNNGFES
jgi:hypothetical protein